LEAVVGLLFVAGFVVLFAATAVLLHVLGRPSEAPEVRVSDALSDLEPRGGRQRFSVRLFEVSVLGAAWVLLSGVLVLVVPTVENIGPVGRLCVAVMATSVPFVTWWAWRRGVLRSPRAARLVGGDEGESG
jgi:hypothetical protein